MQDVYKIFYNSFWHNINLNSSLSMFHQTHSVQFSSVTQLCPTLCNPMDYHTPVFPAHHRLLELTETHVRWVGHPTILSSVILFSSCLQSFPASESFPMSQFFTSDGQSIGVSASVSVLPMNIQDWFPLGLTSWISLQSKELSFYVFALFGCAVLCCALCGILVLLPEIKLIAHGSGRAES